jgi:hypothetical protein
MSTALPAMGQADVATECAHVGVWPEADMVDREDLEPPARCSLQAMATRTEPNGPKSAT